MVIAKSITRLARNTVTLLETARELKTLGTDIYFEKEHIHTLSSDGELMLTLLASFAQEESRSASENVKWRIRKKFEQGYPTYFSIYGYRFENGVLQVIPEEAKIVKMIFSDFLSGMGRVAIARKLNHMGITTRQGNLWTEQSILHILRGEKYTGNLLLQKTYRLDYINKIASAKDPAAKEESIMTGKEFKKMYDEINPTYNTIDEVPSYWRDDIRELVEKGIISGVGGGKLGLTHSDCKAAVLAKRIVEKLK